MSKTKEKPFRITEEMLMKACNFEDINRKYPFIRILPTTYPSKRGRKLDAFFYKQKLMLKQFAKSRKQNKNKNKNKTKKKKKPSKRFDYIKFIRQQQNQQVKFLSVQNPDLCSIEKCKINGVACEWLKYKGSSIKNGVVLIIHGGAYIIGSPAHKHRQSELISKLTGCVCLLVQYSLAPEHPVPKCVDEIISVYDYLINTMHISPTKISMEGESAGGGAILLVLQKMKHKLHMDLPCCVWVNSAWTDLSDSLPSKQRNSEFDGMIGYDKRKMGQNFAVGNLDYFGKATGKNHDLKSEIFSPLFGDWNGLCPIYFMCGCTESLLDDTVYAAKYAYDAGVEVKVDLAPFMPHAWPIFAHIPESKAAIVRACEWILQHLATVRSKL